MLRRVTGNGEGKRPTWGGGGTGSKGERIGREGEKKTVPKSRGEPPRERQGGQRNPWKTKQFKQTRGAVETVTCLNNTLYLAVAEANAGTTTGMDTRWGAERSGKSAGSRGTQVPGELR